MTRLHATIPVLLALYILTTLKTGRCALFTLRDVSYSVCLNNTADRNLYQSHVRHRCDVKGTIANCSDRGFFTVPSDLPSNITDLLFSYNNIDSVQGKALSGYYNLRCLDLSYNNISILLNTSFWNLTQLEVLDLSNNKLALYTPVQSLDYTQLSLQPGFLVPLVGLQVFDFSVNEQQCLFDLVPLLRSITHSDLKVLRMQNIVNSYMPCVTVSEIFASVLPRSLRELVFSSNSLAVIRHKVIASLPENLTILDISDNRLAFGTYLKNFSKLENLKVLKLNGGDLSFSLPTAYPSQEGKTCSRSELSTSQSTEMESSTNGTILKLPRNLKSVEIKIAGWSYSLTDFNIDPNNSLTTFTLNGNNIPNLVGNLTGLNHLKELELVNCNVRFISDHFFCNFPSLKKLDLSMNIFGHILSNKTKQSPFKCLKNLKQLNVSFALIITISKVALAGLDSLEELHMQSNPMYYFTPDISHMRNLRFINFSFTEVARLSSHVTRALDSIIRNRKRPITIDFGEAPIHCDCVNLDFLGWLVTAKIDLTNQNNKCVFDDSSEQRVADGFLDMHQTLKRQCTPRTGLFIGVFAATFLIVLVITASIIYRFRWKLRYLYYSAYLSLKSTENQTDKLNRFEYDVFISYVSEDQTFVMKTLYPKLQAAGLKVHVHCLHFLAGQPIGSNIVDAIQNSRYTLVVLTRELLDSVWCKFELQMANMEQVHTGRPVLVFLLMENLTKKELGTELLYHIQNSTYIMYPDSTVQPNEQQINIFWTKLVSDLRS
ncbi:unnamed protein product [Candidula unifasciata]|uniref:TIR domain-containing protein n=1 Tax=Candidula unifasciata TaxID=100452 RepID=A0A8S4A5W8_9EUPU|nr:unnamed protein product [Candidula unifasciata]